MNVKLSHNGRYLMVGETLHDLSIMESFNVKDLSFDFWISFLKENTLGTYKNGVKDLISLNNFLREFVYNLSPIFEGKNRDRFIFEYELKHSSNLIKENVENQVQTLENFWGFVETNLKSNGIFEQEKSLLDKTKEAASGAISWVKQKGISWVMENLRAALYSWGGAAVQTFLGTVGAPYGGNIVLWVVWGAMLAYDVYEAISGRPNYFNILIDIISIATFGVGGKIFVEGFKKLGIAAGPITRNLPQMLQKISASPLGKKFATTMTTVGKGTGNVLSYLGKGITYAGDKLGATAVKSSGSRITSWARNFISQIVNNPMVKKVASSKLTPTLTTGALVAGINQATNQDNKVFAGSFGKRGDEILAQSQGLPTQKDFEEQMKLTQDVDADYSGLFSTN
jgi:hypothetical protein